MDHVVLDIEIQRCIGDDGLTWDDTDKLGVACACLWEFRTERMRIYGPSDVAALQDRLLQADRISGYNIWKFDLPVIWGLPSGGRVEDLRIKVDDLLRRIWIATGSDPDSFGDSHRGWGLDAVADVTLNARKIGYGGDAPKWFQAGQWARVCNYCCDDVALERDLTVFLDHYGYINTPKALCGRWPQRILVPAWQSEGKP